MRPVHPLPIPSTRTGLRVSTPRHVRVASALAALTATVAIGSVVLLSFHTASPVLWLAPTPEVMRLVEGCDQLGNRTQRDRCKKQVVAAQLRADPAPVRLAQGQQR